MNCESVQKQFQSSCLGSRMWPLTIIILLSFSKIRIKIIFYNLDVTTVYSSLKNVRADDSVTFVARKLLESGIKRSFDAFLITKHTKKYFYNLDEINAFFDLKNKQVTTNFTFVGCKLYELDI